MNLQHDMAIYFLLMIIYTFSLFTLLFSLLYEKFKKQEDFIKNQNEKLTKEIADLRNYIKK